MKYLKMFIKGLVFSFGLFMLGINIWYNWEQVLAVIAMGLIFMLILPGINNFTEWLFDEEN